MNDGWMGLFGLARKAGKAEAGEESVWNAIQAHKARLVLAAADASARTKQRFQRLCESQSNCVFRELPQTKAELGVLWNWEACSVIAVTDIGFAAAVVQKIAEQDPSSGAVAERLCRQAAKANRRRQQRRKPKNPAFGGAPGRKKT